MWNQNHKIMLKRKYNLHKMTIACIILYVDLNRGTLYVNHPPISLTLKQLFCTSALLKVVNNHGFIIRTAYWTGESAIFPQVATQGIEAKKQYKKKHL